MKRGCLSATTILWAGLLTTSSLAAAEPQQSSETVAQKTLGSSTDGPDESSPQLNGVAWAAIDNPFPNPFAAFAPSAAVEDRADSVPLAVPTPYNGGSPGAFVLKLGADSF